MTRKHQNIQRTGNLDINDINARNIRYSLFNNPKTGYRDVERNPVLWGKNV